MNQTQPSMAPPNIAEHRAFPSDEGAQGAEEFNIAESHRFFFEDHFREQRDPQH